MRPFAQGPAGSPPLRRPRPRFRAHLLLAALLALLPGRAEATWSLVVVDCATGEVGVASATCLSQFDLREALPVVMVGKGAAAAQASIDQGATNRRIMFRGFRMNQTPLEIFDEIRFNGAAFLQSRQFGIVSMIGEPFSFTGTQNGAAAFGRSGTSGSIKYAIQGNVLTGPEVVLAAEQAFLATDGDVSQRLMAGMKAARGMGGDGRCSCDDSFPTSCGVPPPSFTKSDHVGFIVLSRIGDTDGECNGRDGCVSGDYYLNLNVIAGIPAPDPVLILDGAYDAWRANLAGRPDHLLSEVKVEQGVLPPDGTSRTEVNVRLVDLRGVPLTGGGAEVVVESLAPDGRQIALAGEVTDHGDGTYSFPVVAGRFPGVQGFRISADDGVARATLHPDTFVRVEAPSAARTPRALPRAGGATR